MSKYRHYILLPRITAVGGVNVKTMVKYRVEIDEESSPFPRIFAHEEELFPLSYEYTLILSHVLADVSEKLLHAEEGR